MYDGGIKCSITAADYTYDSELSSNIETPQYINDNLQLVWKNDSNTICLSVINTSGDAVFLNKLELRLDSLNSTGYTSLMLVPESPSKDIKLNHVSNIKNNLVDISFLYTSIIGHEDYESLCLGFLSSHISRNYFKILKENDIIHVYAVFDFVHHKLIPGEKLELDLIYEEFGSNYFNLLNNYSILLANSCDASASSESLKGLTEYPSHPLDNILFSGTLSEDVLMINNKPVFIKYGREKLYALDITSFKARKKIINRYVKFENEKKGFVCVKNVMLYTLLILKNKIFNPYYEISRLLSEIKSSINTLKLIFDDCPEGIAIGYMDVISKSFFEKEAKLLKGIKKASGMGTLNYDFIIRTLTQNSIFKSNASFNIKNNKIKRGLELISLSTGILKSEDSKINEVINDVKVNSPVITYINRDETFALLRYGEKALYIAVFNFKKSSTRFYCDFSLNPKVNIPDGVASDIFNENNYLIADGKIDIRRLPPEDCCFIKKPLLKNSL